MGTLRRGPRIETARLELRPYGPEDLDALHALWVEPEVRRYLWDDLIITRERAGREIDASIAAFADGRPGQWTLRPRERSVVVGFCGFHSSPGRGECWLLYGLHPDWWRGGLAGEAARAALRYAFEEAGLERVRADTDLPNAASIRVLERCGMRRVEGAGPGGGERLEYVLHRSAAPPEDAPYRVWWPE